MGSRRAFVAEDVADIRVMTCQALEREGFTVTAAWNGREALGMLRRDHLYDVFVLDNNMLPGPTGLELLGGLIREMNVTAPVILYSGDEDNADAARAEGGLFLLKGGPPSELADLVVGLLPAEDEAA